MTRGKTLPQSEVDRINRLYDEKGTIAAVVRATGYDRNTVAKYVDIGKKEAAIKATPAAELTAREVGALRKLADMAPVLVELAAQAAHADVTHGKRAKAHEAPSKVTPSTSTFSETEVARLRTLGAVLGVDVPASHETAAKLPRMLHALVALAGQTRVLTCPACQETVYALASVEHVRCTSCRKPIPYRAGAEK